MERVIASHPGRRSCEDKGLSLRSRKQQENMDSSLLVMDWITLDRDWFSWFRADLAAQIGRLCFQERLSPPSFDISCLFPLPSGGVLRVKYQLIPNPGQQEQGMLLRETC